MSNITPTQKAKRPGELAPAFKAAIEEQQRRAFQLHSLLQCLQVGLESSDCDLDEVAATDALIKLADEIASGLDAGSLGERARQLVDEGGKGYV